MQTSRAGFSPAVCKAGTPDTRSARAFFLRLFGRFLHPGYNCCLVANGATAEEFLFMNIIEQRILENSAPQQNLWVLTGAMGML
jgi:hypothetical protein